LDTMMDHPGADKGRGQGRCEQHKRSSFVAGITNTIYLSLLPFAAYPVVSC